MSCTPEFIKANAYDGSNPNYNWAMYEWAFGLVPKMQAVLDQYDQGKNPSCNGITHGKDNHYSTLAGFLQYANGQNDNLVTTCVNVDAPYKMVMDRNQQLEGEINELSNDEKTAKLRIDLLRSRDSQVTNHQVFLLGRPLRPASIPLLWALSVLFIGIAVLIFYMFNPFDLVPSNALLFQTYLFIRNPVFIGAALLITTGAIILGTLYKAGIL